MTYNRSKKSLCSTCFLGDEEITKYLLRHGADVTLKNIDGKTPLDMADIGIILISIEITNDSN